MLVEYARAVVRREIAEEKKGLTEMVKEQVSDEDEAKHVAERVRTYLSQEDQTFDDLSPSEQKQIIKDSIKVGQAANEPKHGGEEKPKEEEPPVQRKAEKFGKLARIRVKDDLKDAMELYPQDEQEEVLRIIERDYGDRAAEKDFDIDGAIRDAMKEVDLDDKFMREVEETNEDWEKRKKKLEKEEPETKDRKEWEKEKKGEKKDKSKRDPYAEDTKEEKEGWLWSDKSPGDLMKEKDYRFDYQRTRKKLEGVIPYANSWEKDRVAHILLMNEGTKVHRMGKKDYDDLVTRALDKVDRIADHLREKGKEPRAFKEEPTPEEKEQQSKGVWHLFKENFKKGLRESLEENPQKTAKRAEDTMQKMAQDVETVVQEAPKEKRQGLRSIMQRAIKRSCEKMDEALK